MYIFQRSLSNSVEETLCLGITRLERWKRAQDHDLEPPIKAKEILEEHSNDTRFTEWLVFDKKGNCEWLKV